MREISFIQDDIIVSWHELKLYNIDAHSSVISALCKGLCDGQQVLIASLNGRNQFVYHLVWPENMPAVLLNQKVLMTIPYFMLISELDDDSLKSISIDEWLNNRLNPLWACESKRGIELCNRMDKLEDTWFHFLQSQSTEGSSSMILIPPAYYLPTDLKELISFKQKNPHFYSLFEMAWTKNVNELLDCSLVSELDFFVEDAKGLCFGMNKSVFEVADELNRQWGIKYSKMFNYFINKHSYCFYHQLHYILTPQLFSMLSVGFNGYIRVQSATGIRNIAFCDLATKGSSWINPDEIPTMMVFLK